MQKKQFTIGVDVSKLTLDVHCAELNQHQKITNDSVGFKQFLKFLNLNKIPLNDCFVVMEYTGGYEFRFVHFCESKLISYTRLPGLAIKKSMGIVRGKNDKIDAYRIAQYGEEKHKQLEPAKPINKAIVALKDLLAFRKR
jgi:transposase